MIAACNRVVMCSVYVLFHGIHKTDVWGKPMGKDVNGKKKNLRPLMLAAAKSGSGKTTLVCGLLQLLKMRGIEPVSFKCGPDYIDPMFHERVLQVPSRNLDTWLADRKTVRELFFVRCRVPMQSWQSSRA